MLNGTKPATAGTKIGMKKIMAKCMALEISFTISIYEEDISGLGRAEKIESVYIVLIAKIIAICAYRTAGLEKIQDVYTIRSDRPIRKSE